MTLRELGERGLIRRVRQRLGRPRPDVLTGIGDDCAVVAWSRPTLLLTTDALVEDVHFRRATASLRDIGAKSLAVNVSDIAAMGGEPRFALLTLGVPPWLRVEDVDELYAGLAEVADEHGVALVGGDTTASPQGLLLSITVVGQVAGAPTSRAGAQEGDLVLVTGTLGAAAAGLVALEHGKLSLPAATRATVERAHHRPLPRVREGRVIQATGGATAMMDLSDGLASDLAQIAAESGVGADVRLAALPVAEAAREVAAVLGVDPVIWAVSGGEDYELLFTAPPQEASHLQRRVMAETGTPVSIIGEIRRAAEGVRFLDASGRPVSVPDGFDHFGPPHAPTSRAAQDDQDPRPPDDPGPA